MVGIRLFPFGARPICRGELLVSGSVILNLEGIHGGERAILNGLSYNRILVVSNILGSLPNDLSEKLGVQRNSRFVGKDELKYRNTPTSTLPGKLTAKAPDK